MLKNSVLRLNCTSAGTLARIRLLSVPPSATVPSGKETEMAPEPDVLFDHSANAGLITLNRPAALNALNTSMVDKIYPVLKEWETSKKLVIIEGAENRAFCAGGDVKSIVLPLSEANENIGKTFFRKEYSLNYLIGTYKIPYVALMDGITMGGGVGLSVHGKYRVATENTVFAMPETAIGLFPDVGGTYFLPKLKGITGLYLGLTGFRLKGVDALHGGIATHFVPSAKISELKEELLNLNTSDIDQVLNKYRPEKISPKFCLDAVMEHIDQCFSTSTIEEIMVRLKNDGSDWAKRTTKTLLAASPTSLKVTMKALEKGKNLSLKDCLKMEYRLACACLTKGSDFQEGVRALLIDKDQKPAWNPKSIEAVTMDYVNQRFAPLPPEMELKL